jgi:hypothetical protein
VPKTHVNGLSSILPAMGIVKLKGLPYEGVMILYSEFGKNYFDQALYDRSAG